MITITENMTINEVIQKYPETMKVFNDFKVDSCCGGGQSIAVTAAMGNANVPELIKALNEAVNRKES
jgi:regulator of cell morphogenesis and NO signaling